MRPLTIDHYRNHLGQYLTPARLQYSLGVMQVMEILAPVYGLDPVAAQIAGLHVSGKAVHA